MVTDGNLASPPNKPPCLSGKTPPAKRCKSRERRDEGIVVADFPRSLGMAASTESPLPATEVPHPTSLRLQALGPSVQICTGGVFVVRGRVLRAISGYGKWGRSSPLVTVKFSRNPVGNHNLLGGAQNRTVRPRGSAKSLGLTLQKPE